MKAILKQVVSTVFQVLVSPLALVYSAASKLGGSHSVFVSSSQFLSLFPGKIGVYLRAAYYAWVCEGTSKQTSIGFLTTLSHADTTFRNGVYIGSHGNIGKCTIGANCLLGSGVHVLSGNRQHSFSDPNIPMKDQPGSFVKISIGEDTWIGNQAVIMANVGTRCVVAAGAVVTKPVEDYCIVVGNPATVVSRTQKTSTEAAQSPKKTSED